jgi:hypothetical protein
MANLTATELLTTADGRPLKAAALLLPPSPVPSRRAFLLVLPLLLFVC